MVAVDSSTPHGRPISHVLALLVLCILVPAVFLTGTLLWQIGILDRTRADHQALQLARSVTRDLDREIDGSIETLLALATSKSLQQGDFQTFYQQAAEAMSFRKLHILLKSRDGSQILNTRVPFGQEIPRSPLLASDKQLIAGRAPAVSDLVIGNVTKKWVLAISVPVVREGEVVYILSMSVDPEHIRRIIVDEPRDPEWTIAVSDRNGRLIARSQEHAAYIGREIHTDVHAWSRGQEGVHRTATLAGHELVQGYASSTKSGWIIAAFVPSIIVDAPLASLWRMFSLLALMLGGLAVPLTYFLSRQITKPIVLAAQAARMLGRGEVISVASSGLQEANELATALATASSNLRARTRQLEENEARYRSVFEQSAVGFEQVALDGKLLGVNDRLCKMLGYTREECLEKTFKVLTHPDDWAMEDDLICTMLKGDTPHYTVEKRLITKSGDAIWVRITSAPVPDADGKALYRTSVVEDVTERRKAREAAARLAAIVQASQDAMFSTSLSGNIETWNPGAAKLFGYQTDEVIGKSLKILTPKVRSSDFDANLAAIARGETLQLETKWQHKDGSLIDVSVSATQIRGLNHMQSISVTAEDIRDRKQREAHILTLNRELVHRVKNMLAVIQSIANQTMRSTPDPRTFRDSFQGRLQALSAANDLLMQTSWGGSDLSDFVDRQLAPLMPRGTLQLRKDGPPVHVPAELSVHLGLALHELGTNAIKYGAWSVPGGIVRVSWQLQFAPFDETRRLILTWSEHGGPPVKVPTRSGFGTTLIERGIPDAKIERRFSVEGLVCKIEVPLPVSASVYEG
jgi:PAS domain S-box-containing protein